MALERGGGEGEAIVTPQTIIEVVGGETHHGGQTVASWVVPRREDAAPEDHPVGVVVHTSSLA